MSDEEMRPIDELREMLPTRPVFEIEFTDDNIDYLHSKIGGAYFWPDVNSPKLQFLAQINLSELPENDVFPKSGMLQFFIGDDSSYGLFAKKGGSLVVYHKDISYGIEVYKDFPNSPILKPSGMKFILKEEPMSSSDFRFKEYSFQFDEADLGEEVYDEFSGIGCKLLGYPFFTQYDPRRKGDEHDTLLFQLDSDSVHVMWGDVGVCNFFINEEALKNMDFSDVLYNWDCC